MAELIEIKHIERALHRDPYQADSEQARPHQIIAAVGGTSISGTKWRLSHQRAIEDVEAGKWQFFVRNGLHTVDVVVATHEGQKYLKSTVDELWPDSLLKLSTGPQIKSSSY